MKYKTALRVLCAIVSVLLLLPSFIACGKEETLAVDQNQVVGTVNGKDVYYDELYFLVQYYYDSVKENCGGDSVQMQAELDRLVKENITANYAILALCENLGLTYREKDWKDEIDAELEQIIDDSYGGDEEAYLADMKEVGLTERYLRYTTGLDLLYNSLLTEYPQRGLVATKDTEILNYIKQNFLHVYHLALFNDSDEEKEANYRKLSEAAEKLQSGEATIYELIKKGYTEDFSDPSASGYYITKDTMEKTYEEAAFDLEINEVSNVVISMGENNDGRWVSCYYVIQRVAIDEDYIQSHLTALQTQYYGSVIAGDLEKIEQTLSFIPNEFYASLNLCELLSPEEPDTTWIVILCVAGGVLLIAAIAVPVILLKKSHAKKNLRQSHPKDLSRQRRKE